MINFDHKAICGLFIYYLRYNVIMELQTRNYNLIAEIGCNHQGDIKKAQEMIVEAKACGCNFVKFQKREPKLQFSPEKYNSPHPNPQNAFGRTYGEHRENLEFSKDEHKFLMEFTNSLGLEYSCSVFDVVSAQNIIDIQPSHIKIPSPVNNHTELVELIAKNFDGTIHVSLGMSTKEDEKNLVDILEKYGKLENTILYHCVSSYPTQSADISLFEISRLKEKYANKIKAVGLSSHYTDYIADCMGLALGAKYIEKHFTFDKFTKGSDHIISLDYPEMLELSEKLYSASLALNYKEKELLDCELPTYNFHKYKKEAKNNATK